MKDRLLVLDDGGEVGSRGGLLIVRGNEVSEM